MEKFSRWKGPYNPYESLGLTHNPILITPLFLEFRNRDRGAEEEYRYSLSPQLERELSILLYMENRRALIYGPRGVGKSTFGHFILYLAYHYHRRFCLSLNLDREMDLAPFQKIIYRLSLDLVEEIGHPSQVANLPAVQQWLANRKYTDPFLSYMVQLMGIYAERHDESAYHKTKKSLQAFFGGIGSAYSYETEMDIKNRLLSCAQALTPREATRHLVDFLEIVHALDFRNLFVLIDGGKSLEDRGDLAFPHRAQEMFFTPEVTFIVIGGEDMGSEVSEWGRIFDKIVALDGVDWDTYLSILDGYMKMGEEGVGVDQVFTDSALKGIYDMSKGVAKNLLRLAQNALDRAAMEGASKVDKDHCERAFAGEESHWEDHLKDKEREVLTYLGEHPASSPSHDPFQDAIDLKRVHLRNYLEDLRERGYVIKEKEGRETLYSLSERYQRYFGGEN